MWQRLLEAHRRRLLRMYPTPCPSCPAQAGQPCLPPALPPIALNRWGYPMGFRHHERLRAPDG